ncbi:MAG: ABC transporter ATP-binding protein [Planctomycetes bacterium]|nr:ABC transporter ATP-binding protein [Planctomycetota bacterium]
MTLALEIRSITKTFGALKAVNEVSFQVKRGEILGFIGPNGAGKTTTMRICATLEYPDHGDVFVDGHSVLTYPREVRARLGFMPDSYGAYANTTIWEYLDFYARAYGLKGASRSKRVGEVMDFTQLGDLQEKEIATLSKGMKQRLCLAKTLLHDPSVMILDEPAAGLDPRARVELRELVRALAGMGKAILVSSHILTELAEMCDGVAVIERGTLKFEHQGTPEDLSKLLAALVAQGLAPVEFAPREANLEEVFLSLTEGGSSRGAAATAGAFRVAPRARPSPTC